MFNVEKMVEPFIRTGRGWRKDIGNALEELLEN